MKIQKSLLAIAFLGATVLACNNAEETSTEEASAVGEAIRMAVTREIAEQQRPGGLLSPI